MPNCLSVLVSFCCHEFQKLMNNLTESIPTNKIHCLYLNQIYILLWKLFCSLIIVMASFAHTNSKLNRYIYLLISCK